MSSDSAVSSSIIKEFCKLLECPKMGGRFNDPVITSDGLTYERSALEQRISMPTTQLQSTRSYSFRNSAYPNILMRQIVVRWKLIEDALESEKAQARQMEEELERVNAEIARLEAIERTRVRFTPNSGSSNRFLKR
ncbi:hypothetical protein BC830DRAFT_725178 [Chytriomyces sp. MP71]|nr:hypothetical protein BC830DRAFT_725178 [Chytriomyces sp. MP71]